VSLCFSAKPQVLPQKLAHHTDKKHHHMSTMPPKRVLFNESTRPPKKKKKESFQDLHNKINSLDLDRETQAHLVLRCTLDHYKTPRTKAVNARLSPERLELFNEFLDLDEKFPNPDSSDKMLIASFRLSLCKVYISRYNRYAVVAPTTAEEAENTSPPSHTSITSNKNSESLPRKKKKSPKKKKYRRFQWDKVSSELYETLPLAKSRVQQFPQLSIDSSGNMKGTRPWRYSCKPTGNCKAIIKVTGGNIAVKKFLAEGCGCSRIGLEKNEQCPMLARIKLNESMEQRPGWKKKQHVDYALQQCSYNVEFSEQKMRQEYIIQLTDKIKRYYDTQMKKWKESGVDMAIRQVGDIIHLRNKYAFKLPYPAPPEGFDIGELSKTLYDDDLLHVIPPLDSKDGVSALDAGIVRSQAHRFLTILDGSRESDDEFVSHAEQRLYTLIEDETAKKGPNNGSFDSTIVFSSLALLSNIRECAKLDYRVSCSADGSADMCSNNFKLLNFGCISIARDGTRSFRPFLYALARGESKLSFAVALVTFLKYSRRLFGEKDMVWKGGLISDHAGAFVSVFEQAFHGSMLMQCWPHIKRKFIPGRKGNFGYSKFFSSKFLKGTASEDVTMLHRCQSKAMFKTMWELVAKAWSNSRQNELRKTFSGSYISQDKYNGWFIGCVDVETPLTIPQNNSNERNSLLLKGSRQFVGRVDIGLEMGRMLQTQFPTAVQLASIECQGVHRPQPMDDEKWLFQPASNRYQAITSFAKYACPTLDINRDFRKPFVYVNCNDNFDAMDYAEKNFASALTERRLKLYEAALAGCADSFGFEQRSDYLDLVEGICCVVPVMVNGKESYRGSCYQYRRNGYCNHAVFIQYHSKVVRWSENIDTHKRKATPKKVLQSKYQSVIVPKRELVMENCEKIIKRRVDILSLLGMAPQYLHDEKLSKTIVKTPDLEEWKIEIDPKKGTIFDWNRREIHMTKALRDSFNVYDSLRKYVHVSKDTPEKELRLMKATISRHNESFRQSLELLIFGKTFHQEFSSPNRTLTPNPNPNPNPTMSVLSQPAQRGWV